jgi:polyisoprenoid-binding protein YceI
MNKTNQLWNIDSSHSGIHFSVRHMVISKVRGQFARWAASFEAPEGDLGRARLTATIDASSIDTGVADRDAHLRSADFFDAATYPEITFVSKKVERVSDDELRVVGDLTIRGTTREVPLAVEVTGQGVDPWGNQRAGFSAKATIDRRDFGLSWNQLLETGGVLVGEKITIEIDVEAVKQAAGAARAA